MKPAFNKLTLLSALLVALAGCQTMKPNEDRLKTTAQTTIGEPVTKISNVRNDNSATYFIASTASGDYNCELPSGVMVGIASMGMGMSAHCYNKNSGRPQNPLQRY
ncbi:MULTISPECIES: hypothetical protein [Pseudomonas]|uniref:hypothetical protein n=1 Tax=Pseudomonas TaxID=286 RepID=UPI00029A5913|nr:MULTISPECIES: hypothetical protein [Pseudomonas]MBF4209678.1 hypothetical protein [Pseudomonas donghuensis]MBS7601191.1 hypothetical protein [Pseudomonas sp. RC2C2]MCP6697960.1 hypothetical protein [Pseudomonas donghuensis]PJY93892.1 hypothetical protein COO64_23410 [Pseudomonas donghuensis]QHF28720.1 hypothetical protein PspR32_13260 [Pseudomonas sp. R32]